MALSRREIRAVTKFLVAIRIARAPSIAAMGAMWPKPRHHHGSADGGAAALALSPSGSRAEAGDVACPSISAALNGAAAHSGGGAAYGEMGARRRATAPKCRANVENVMTK